MELPNSKINLSVHLGQDSGQSTLAEIDVTNHVGEGEVFITSFRSMN